MFGNDIEGRYKHDSTFRRVVDQMRALLSAYHITPGELREASILAATMHESENIRPLYILKYDRDAMIYPMRFDMNPPALFGGDSRTGRWVTSTPNVTEQDKKSEPEKPKYKCICNYTGTVAALHSQTCKDYNWSVTHPSLFTEHVYGEWHKGLGNDNEWRMCIRCQMSSTYIEHNKITTCTGKYVQPKS
jgi:hypothetical protein